MSNQIFPFPVDAGEQMAQDVAMSVLAENGPLLEPEGQLAVDVINTAEELLVVAPMAGTAPQDIELHLHNDLLTIRGTRARPPQAEGEPLLQECHWGRFSRSVVLPCEIKSEHTQAEYRQGVLVVRLPKSQTGDSIPITVVE